MGRRFITRSDVDAALGEGRDVLRVGHRDTVTDVAREYAQQRGVRIEREDDGGGSGGSTGRPAGEADRPRTASSADHDRLRRRVRRAVVEELGTAPPGLDDAIDRAIASQGGTG